ncbi:MAG: 50S ribosomal protein L17 [Leptospiraceae bacterium]|nr:50S ribosomal protein L17 [Leptospiraceae bacterium]MCP5501947.1 50S ribosomal protein L17 [Leptospiraceae bacterium]
MNKRIKLKKLNKNSAHRKAMLKNMVTSLFRYERIETTIARAKVLRSLAEKLITRGKKNLIEGISPEKALHNKREVMKLIGDRDIVVKLFEDLAKRYESRNGGYTRILKLVNRPSDNSEVCLLELVDRKTPEVLKEEEQKKIQLEKEDKKKKKVAAAAK